MKWTAESVKAAALTFNADYPEAVEPIAAGKPVIHVSIVSPSKYSSKTVRLVRTPGIETADGGFIGAASPEVLDTARPKYPVEKLGLWYGNKIADKSSVTVKVVKNLW